MVKIIGIGNPVNSALPLDVDFSAAFADFGLLQRYDFKAPSISHSTVAGTPRASEVAPITGAGVLSQFIDLHKPEYIAGGGPNGLTDAISFNRTRGDRLDCPDFVSGSHTRATILKLNTLGTTFVNGLIHGTNISGDGRNVLYCRENTLGAPTISAYIGQTGVEATATVAVPIDTWMLALQVWNAATRAIRVGYRPMGGNAVIWSTADTGEIGTTVLQTDDIGMGSDEMFATGFNGQIAGMALFSGFNAYDTPDLLTAIDAYCFGDDSIYGM